MPEILNYGGGVQSVAMAILVVTGRLPLPDYVIAADTGREMPSTWQYADQHIRPLLHAIDRPLHVAPHSLATVDLYAHNGDLLLPVFTGTGKLSAYCSTEWKARVVSRYIRRVLHDDTPIVSWLGFTLDERHRAKSDAGRRYPLLDLMLTRGDCEQIIQDAGLPIPRKSRCFMCPHQSPDEWAEVKADPVLWQQAVELDAEVRAADDRGPVYLHQSATPLDTADLGARPTAIGRQCGLGMCYL